MATGVHLVDNSAVSKGNEELTREAKFLNRLSDKNIGVTPEMDVTQIRSFRTNTPNCNPSQQV